MGSFSLGACRQLLVLLVLNTQAISAEGPAEAEAEDWLQAFSAKSERRKKRQKYQLVIPRVSAAELAENATLMSGHVPFIVTGAMEEWPAMHKWTDLRYLSSQVPQEWVDFYKRNMYNIGDKPFLFRMDEATQVFLGRSEFNQPRYMQLRLSLKGWQTLEKDLKKDASSDRYLPGAMWGESDWISQCMPDEADIDNFYRVNQWNMLLIGEEGTGIFLHNDHLAAASWQAHVAGRKAWIICPNDQKEYMSTHLHVWDPDYKQFPAFAKARCGRAILHPGEILYYPAYWYHSTKCLDTPTIGLTGLMVGVEDTRRDIQHVVHRQFLQDLQRKCANPGEDISKKWPGAAPPISKSVCAALPKCYDLWDQHFQTVGGHYTHDNPYADHLAKGKELKAAGDIPAAIESFRAACRFDGKVLAHWTNLLKLLRHEANPERGSPANKRLVKLCQSQADAIKTGGRPLGDQDLKKKRKAKKAKRKEEL